MPDNRKDRFVVTESVSWSTSLRHKVCSYANREKSLEKMAVEVAHRDDLISRGRLDWQKTTDEIGQVTYEWEGVKVYDIRCRRLSAYEEDMGIYQGDAI